MRVYLYNQQLSLATRAAKANDNYLFRSRPSQPPQGISSKVSSWRGMRRRERKN
jgi:hypothetical protein